MAPQKIHVSREELYTDIHARVKYLHSFLDFNSQDIAALQSCAKYFKQLIPAVVNIVYQKLLAYDLTARALSTRSTTTPGNVAASPLTPMAPGTAQPQQQQSQQQEEQFLNEASPQIQHRKLFLRAYLYKLCSDPSAPELWEYLDKVGMMHVGLGRKHPLHIEYIHMGACLGFIQDILTDAIMSHPKLSLQRKTAFVRAIGKVIWIQNDLIAKWHVRDGEEFTAHGKKKQQQQEDDDDDDSDTVIEQEGYLHGKKILDDIDEANEQSSPSRIPRPSSLEGGSGCPFSAMVQGR
ncbi:Protoglobin-domain-containing protein [Apiospora marii]|uniref:Protoglobin-domain-containing protein n=1 Tax=Apiospora marii TaxID=335849 RepID=A0ABR1T248_9PEZI